MMVEDEPDGDDGDRDLTHNENNRDKWRVADGSGARAAVRVRVCEEEEWIVMHVNRDLFKKKRIKLLFLSFLFPYSFPKLNLIPSLSSFKTN